MALAGFEAASREGSLGREAFSGLLDNLESSEEWRVKRKWPVGVGVGAAALTALMFAVCANPLQADVDFGTKVESLLGAQSRALFGVQRPLEGAFEGSVAREPGQEARDLVELAGGLSAEVLTRDAGNLADMFSFFPSDNPTHLIFCIEGAVENLGVILPGGGRLDKLNPSVQRITIADGSVETVLRGMSHCDGIRTTAWGTVLATEETADGGAYEILDPLAVTNATVTNRAAGSVLQSDGTPETRVAKRDALPTMAWEGLAVLDNGVIIAGDELRPGTPADVEGGAIFKFVPDSLHAGGSISDLADSPLGAGTTWAMQVSCVDDAQQFGQGCEIGNAGWVAVSAATARGDADANGATGYYRPEDLHLDPTFAGSGVRFCWTNTGNEDGANYGEVICGIDSAPDSAGADRTVVVNRFIEGDTAFNSLDNLAFQPTTGVLYVIEDHENGEVYACLPDRADRDLKTDGCVSILSVKDASAEPTGFEFSADGQTAYLSIQHSDDEAMAEVDGYRTDDIVIITGFRPLTAGGRD